MFTIIHESTQIILLTHAILYQLVDDLVKIELSKHFSTSS